MIAKEWAINNNFETLRDLTVLDLLGRDMDQQSLLSSLSVLKSCLEFIPSLMELKSILIGP